MAFQRTCKCCQTKLPIKRNTTLVAYPNTCTPSAPFGRNDAGCVGGSPDPCTTGPWPVTVSRAQTFSTLTTLTCSFTYASTTITASASHGGTVKAGMQFVICGQTGINAVLNGTWVVGTVPDNNSFTFAILTAPSGDLSNAVCDFRHVINTCPDHGYKVVQAHRLWAGKQGFLDKSPKITARYLGISGSVSILESYSSSGYNTSPITHYTYYSTNTFSGQGSASYNNSCTAYGVLSAQSNSAGNSSGRATQTSNDPSFVAVDTFSCGVGVGIYNAAFNGLGKNYYSTLCNGSEPIPPNSDTALSGLACQCALSDGKEGIFHLVFPWGVYDGEIGGLAAWLSTFNAYKSWTPSDPGNSTGHLQWTYSIQSITVQNDKIDITVNAAMEYTDTGEGSQLDASYGLLVKIQINLGNENKASDLQKDTQGLLNYWNMADHLQYPWRTDGYCTIAPMVGRREKGGFPLVGCGQASDDAATAAFYDGSVTGAPLETGWYRSPSDVLTNDTAWFDYDHVIYNYSESGGNIVLCYKYGTYPPWNLPTNTTQVTTGAFDSHPYPGFSPFSRYKVNYIYQQFPPFVFGGQAFVAISNGVECWASKYCEIKEPLASQNFFGPTGVFPNQYANDPRGDVGWTGTAMRDLTLQNSSTCEPSETLRYPYAEPNTTPLWPIAGRAEITAMSEDGGTPNTVTITAAVPQVRAGDVLELCNQDMTVLAEVTVVTSSGSTFTYQGAKLDAAKYVVSKGTSQTWQYYDIRPKGDFVFAWQLTTCTPVTGGFDYTVQSFAEQKNIIEEIRKKGYTDSQVIKKRMVICICPPDSPEVTGVMPVIGVGPTVSVVSFNPKQSVIKTDYPEDVGSANKWEAQIVQGMPDRFWITNQDSKTSSGGVCVDKTVTVPMVEARLYAPLGAPMQFATDSPNQWVKLPTANDFYAGCSGIYNYGEIIQPYTASLDKPTPQAQTAGSVNYGAADIGGAGGTYNAI